MPKAKSLLQNNDPVVEIIVKLYDKCPRKENLFRIHSKLCFLWVFVPVTCTPLCIYTLCFQKKKNGEDDFRRNKIAAFSKDIAEYVLCGQLINMIVTGDSAQTQGQAWVYNSYRAPPTCCTSPKQALLYTATC